MLFSATDMMRSSAPPTEPTTQGHILSADFDDTAECHCLQLLSAKGLGKLLPDGEKHFYSRGAFNLVELVFYLLKQTGPANVFLSTYGIAEDSLAALRRRLDRKTILSLRLLIDNRVRTISPKPFAYLATAFEGCYRCCALHAKVALIWNDSWHISVVTSMNATHNPKLERGIVSTRRDIFDFDLKTLSDEFDQGTT